jgi:hypothetical protein
MTYVASSSGLSIMDSLIFIVLIGQCFYDFWQFLRLVYYATYHSYYRNIFELKDVPGKTEQKRNKEDSAVRTPDAPIYCYINNTYRERLIVELC